MLKRLKRKEIKQLDEQTLILKEKMDTLSSGYQPLKVETMNLKRELATQKAKNFKMGYKKLQERLNYVLSYFQDYEQNIIDANKAIEEKELDSIIDAIEAFDEFIEELSEIELELKDIKGEITLITAHDKKSSKSAVLEFKEFGDMIGDAVRRAFNKDDSSNPKSKTSKLLKILPFLEDAEKKEIVDQILSDSEYFSDVKLAVIVPFLDQADVDKIFIHEIKKNSKQLQSLVPFVSEELLTEIVDQYLAGEITLNMDILYPFLKMEDIKRVFFFELKQEN